MVEKNLIMSFEGEDGKKLSITIKDVNDEASKADVVNGIMDHILTTGIITSKGVALTNKLSAEVISKETTEIALA